MTINIAIAVAEGMVMAADSVQQIGPVGQVITTHSSVEKLTEIGTLPMAAMVHGVGSINNRTVLSLIREWEFNQRAGNPNFKDSTVPEIVNSLADFIEARYNAVQWGPPPQIQTPQGLVAVDPWPPLLGLVVGGYSPHQFFPEFHQIVFPTKAITKKHPGPAMADGAAGIGWWGVEGPLKRLLLGFDLDQLTALHTQLVQQLTLQNQAITQAHAAATTQAQNAGQPPPPAPVVAPIPPSPSDALTPLATQAQMPMNIDGMPLQDAVELADYLGNVAIGYDRFTIGPPSVGGDLDVLAIQPEGLCWYRRKNFAALMAKARSTR